MTLQEQIKADVVTAMKAKESEKVTALKSLTAAFINELAAPNREDRENLTDDEVLAIIKRGVKQRKDSIEQFEQGGRDDLAENEKVELSVLENYLPAMMSDEEILEIATRVKQEQGVEDKSKMGVLIGMVMKETKGQADGGDVKRVVESLFS